MLMELVFEVVLILIVGTIGVFGNCALTIMFLKLKKKQLKFHRIMILLSCFDTIYILLSVVLFAIPGISEEYRNLYHPYVVSIAIPTIQVALTGSVYCTTAISIERYLIVCRPFWTVSNNWSSKRYIIPILIISCVYNVPRFFELTTGVTCKLDQNILVNDTCNNKTIDDNPGNGTSDHTLTFPTEILHDKANFEEAIENATRSCEQMIYHIKVTEMRQNKYYYSFYTIGLNFLFMGLVPFLVLVSSATLILRRLIAYEAEKDNPVVQSNDTHIDRIRSNVTIQDDFYTVDNIHDTHNIESSQVNEHNWRVQTSFKISKRLKVNEIMLARVSLLITFVFVICHSIRWVPNIYELIQRINNQDIEWPSWVESFTCVSHFLTVLNSSVHFYIYYFTRNEIKSHFNCLKFATIARRTTDRTISMNLDVISKKEENVLI